MVDLERRNVGARVKVVSHATLKRGVQVLVSSSEHRKMPGMPPNRVNVTYRVTVFHKEKIISSSIIATEWWDE